MPKSFATCNPNAFSPPAAPGFLSAWRFTESSGFGATMSPCCSSRSGASSPAMTDLPESIQKYHLPARPSLSGRNPAEKRLLEQAAQSAHLSVSAFVLQAASQQAEDLLAERQAIILTPEAARPQPVRLRRRFAQRMAAPVLRSEPARPHRGHLGHRRPR